MGERFLTYRLPAIDPQAVSQRALSHPGHEKAMREELASAICSFFGGLSRPPDLPEMDQAERDFLVQLSCFVVRCRSAVERDGYSREIELVPDAESPAGLCWRWLNSWLPLKS